MKSKRSASDRFNELVVGWVLQTVEGGVNRFGPLVRALPGVYPAVVRDALRRLMRKRSPPSGTAQKMLADVTVKWPHRQGGFIRLALPVPHPLGFDWRYAAAANERLLDEYATLGRPPGRLAVLGAPSIVLAAFWRNPRVDVIALDSDRAMVRAIRRACPGAHVFQRDVMRGRLPAFPDAAVVVADPP